MPCVFASGNNGAPSHPFTQVMSYPALMGHSTVSGVIFAEFNTRSCGQDDQKDYALVPNIHTHDGHFPYYVSNITKLNVNDDNLIHMQEPALGLVNPSDCVDM